MRGLVHDDMSDPMITYGSASRPTFLGDVLFLDSIKSEYYGIGCISEDQNPVAMINLTYYS